MKTDIALVACKACRKTYPHPRTQPDRSTSTLTKHLKGHQKRRAQTQERRSNLQNIAGFLQQSTSAYVGITSAELDQLLLQTAVACNWSFNQFDNTMFRQFFARAFPGHQCPGRRKIKTLLTKAAEEAREEIRNRFANNTSKISLALDCWTSSNGYESMGTSLIVVA